MKSFAPLTTHLGIIVKHEPLFQEAFTHRSYLNEQKSQALQSNERLEFLGDAVLELATSIFLFERLPDKAEGELTSFRSSLVKTETLAAVAQELKLGSYLRMSRGEERSGGRTNPTILANTVEALLGAIYLDQGFRAAKSVLIRFLFPRLEVIIKEQLYRDYKSTLQEVIQSTRQPTPTYKTIDARGPDHQKTFTVQVRVNTTVLGQASGLSKQHAEQLAAKKALEKLKVK